MSFEVAGKYMQMDTSTGEVESTIVQIVKYKPYYVGITQALKGDQMEHTDEYLIDSVLKSFYQEAFKDRANEEKLDALNEQLEEMKEANNLTQLALMDMLMVLSSTLEGATHENVVEEVVEEDEEKKGDD